MISGFLTHANKSIRGWLILKNLKGFSCVCVANVMFLLALPVFSDNDAVEYFQRGLAYQMGETGQPDADRALVEYRKSLEINPNFFHSLYNSGLIYHSAGKLKHAQVVFLKAARVAKKDPSQEGKRLGSLARNGLGSTLFRLKKFHEAEKEFDIARRLSPDMVEAHYNYINSLIRDDRVEEANKAMRYANKVAPSDKYEKFKGFVASKGTLKRFYGMGSWIFAIAVAIAAIFYGMHIRSKRYSTT